MADKKIRYTLNFSLLFFVSIFFFLPFDTYSQVSSVEFGKNRLQFKKLKWQFYQTPNFNTYFYEGGEQLAKYILQVAEEELPPMERFTEYSIQLRANIMVYNSYDDMKQSNIGLGTETQNTGGTTQLNNNKMVVYFNGNHADLRKQIRQGLAKILMENILFGDDLGEMASNKALLDLPKWLTDGYVAYAAENWSPQLDDDLKSELLSFKYKNFQQLAFDKPLLAGHAFFWYIEEKYGRENTTYLIYLARMYKSLNKASRVVTKVPKFNQVLKNFMTYQTDKYQQDIRRRKNYPKGNEVTEAQITRWSDSYNFNINPNRRNQSYVYVRYNKGKYRVLLNDFGEDKVLLKVGHRTRLGDINPDYPKMAWNPKGDKVAVIYGEDGELKLFVYDIVTRVKPVRQIMTGLFDQIQSFQYYFNDNSLLLSAVRNGKTDIFIYDIPSGTVKQVTNDYYDNLDASFVGFPGKTGIIFSSNRPSAEAKGNDTSLMNNRFNIFMVTDFSTDHPELNQVTQLTNMEWGDARFPTQYNVNHFTFISDANGVMNRYAGLFSTKGAGKDTLVVIGDVVLQNPLPAEIDSVLVADGRTDVDTIAVRAITEDSTYTFPITNYASGIRETTQSGENNQISEVTRQSDTKLVFRLKVDEAALRRRNVMAPPTIYREKQMERKKLSEGNVIQRPVEQKREDVFQQQFEVTPEDTLQNRTERTSNEIVLERAKLFPYKPIKFSADYVMLGFNNNVLGTNYQPYQGGQGPIQLNSNDNFMGMLRLGVSDLMEDLRINGGVRIGTNLKDNDWLFQFSNLRKKIDWGLTYYRSVEEGVSPLGQYLYPGKQFSHLYQGTIAYPLDEVRSIRLILGFRRDNFNFYGRDELSLKAPEQKRDWGLMRAEYVYDNTLNPTLNIWDGFRWKVYADFNTEMARAKDKAPDLKTGKNMINLGFDARAYIPIFRNFIWAGRAAGDFSLGDQKMIYYLGGIDNWMMFANNDPMKGERQYRYFNPNNRPAPDADYAFQTLAGNLRGFVQNATNGNNNIVLNSEFRLPVFQTLLQKPINNAFIRNFQLTQFVDLGTAWNGKFGKIGRPTMTYTDPNDPYTVHVSVKAPGVGPFLGGYGFGARSTLLGYFLKLDAGWPMSGFFHGKPIYYFSMGLDF